MTGIGVAAWSCFGGLAHAAWRPQSARPFLSAVVEKVVVDTPPPEPLLVPELAPEPEELMVALEEAPAEPAPATEVAPPPAIVDPAPAPVPRPAHTEAASWRCRLRRAPPPQPQPQPAAQSLANDAPAAAIDPSPLPGHNPPPNYPWVPWRRGIEGTVVLRLEIDAAGVVTAADIVRSSGNADLDREALRCLRTWQFQPAHDASGPHATTMRKDVVFRIVDR